MTEEIVFSQESHLGVVTLNRPQALNALTLKMIHALQQQLLLWQHDSHIHAVVVRAEGEKAFCAGGDVRWLYEAGLANNPEQMQFFWHEYRLNHYIHCYSKPYIALMDGITMGGGVGISLHGSHPVASERFVFAMPETGIGFFPDVGVSYLLARCPGQIGLYLGLTGHRLNADEAQAVGLVCTVVPSNQFQSLLTSLISTDLSTNAHERVDACLQELTAPANKDAVMIAKQQPVLDHCFAQETLENIFIALASGDDEWSKLTLRHLQQKSPLSLQVTFAQIRKAVSLSMAECVQMDYGLTEHFMRGFDFYEGVRALLIDKDKSPHWQPQTRAQISAEMMTDYFTCSKELTLLTT